MWCWSLSPMMTLLGGRGGSPFAVLVCAGCEWFAREWFTGVRDVLAWVFGRACLRLVFIPLGVSIGVSGCSWVDFPSPLFFVVLALGPLIPVLLGPCASRIFWGRWVGGLFFPLIAGFTWGWFAFWDFTFCEGLGFS